MKVKKISERWENGNTCYVDFEYGDLIFTLAKNYNGNEIWTFCDDIKYEILKDIKTSLNTTVIDDIKKILKQIDDSMFP